MALPTCAVIATIYGPTGQPLAGVIVTATLSAQEIDGGMVVPTSESGVTNANGQCVLNLWPNSRGSLGSTYSIVANLGRNNSALILATGVAVPADASANLEDLIAQGITEAVPGVSPATAYWLDPQAQHGAVYDGVTNAGVAVQASLDVPGADAFPISGKKFGKGRLVVARQGVALVSPLDLSCWTALECFGPQGSAVWQHDHSQLSGNAALLKFDDDNDQSSAIGAQTRIRGLVLHGDQTHYDSGVSTAKEYGIYMPNLAGEKDDAPDLSNLLIANFNDDGIHLGQGHNQLRGRNFKSIAHNGWSFWAYKTSDTKINQVGFGRSALGQFHADSCASLQVSQYDMWTPGYDKITYASDFHGDYAVDLVKCRNLRFFQGEIQGVVHIEGGNCSDTDKTRHQHTGIVICGFNIKCSPETHFGTKYTGGGGSAQYSAMVQQRGADNVAFALGMFGYSQGEADADNLTATPKYIFEHSVDSGRDFDKEAGHTELTSVGFIHMNYTAGVRTAQVPFTLRIAKNPERLVWRTTKPGQLLMLPDATAQVNLIKLIGVAQTLNKADYPLLYLGMDDTRKLTDAPTTFTIPAAAGTLPAGYAWFVVAW